MYLKCPNCSHIEKDNNVVYCIKCGTVLYEQTNDIDEKENFIKSDNLGIGINIFILLLILLIPICLWGTDLCKNSTNSNKINANSLLVDTQNNYNKNTSNSFQQKEITVKKVLSEFKDWDGDKTFGKTIYTLNIKNDTYILVIDSNSNDNQKIDWIELYYLKSFQNSYSITVDELEPFQKLMLLIDIDDNSWNSNVIDGELPYEYTDDNWKMNIDYYIYQNKKAGLVLRLSNLINQQTIVSKSTSRQSTIQSKRNTLANGIKSALNAPGHPSICTSVYFNTKGELIIEATSYWGNMSKGDKEDIIFLIEDILLKRKKELNVEGFGQFFSPVGRPMESFYAY